MSFHFLPQPHILPLAILVGFVSFTIFFNLANVKVQAAIMFGWNYSTVLSGKHGSRRVGVGEGVGAGKW